MKLGRIAVETPDGVVPRLVSVHPERELVVDLARAERLRLEGRGARPDRAASVATALFPGSMSAAIALGDAFLDGAQAADAARRDDAALPLAELSWLPAADPPEIRDCITFLEHMRSYFKKIGHDLNPLHYRQPGYYKGSTSRLFGHDDVIPWPHYTDQLDYELEVGLIIGKAGHDLTPEEAEKALFGLTIFNDFSARDYQKDEMLLMQGPQKCKDFANGIGPWITTIDEFEDVGDLAATVRVNGEVWSRNSTKGMMWSIGEILAYVSMGDMLQPGDLVGTGTVGGGSALEQGRRLHPGDTVELELQGVGVLRTRLGHKEEQRWRPAAREIADAA